MPTPEHPRRRSTAARISIGIFYFACVSVIVGWSLREGTAAAQRAAPPAKPVVQDQDVPAAPDKVESAGRARASIDCTSCGVGIGVVEAVRHIETYVEIMEGCPQSESAGSLGPDFSLEDAPRNTVEPLKDIVAAASAGKRGAKKYAVTTRHQIVVRFRNGSRQVLNESTPRALHEGERVIVIAGLGTPGG